MSKLFQKVFGPSGYSAAYCYCSNT